MNEMASPPTAEDQGRLLEEALGMVRQQASQMRRCLETPGKLMDALKNGCVAKLTILRAILISIQVNTGLRAQNTYPRPQTVL